MPFLRPAGGNRRVAQPEDIEELLGAGRYAGAADRVGDDTERPEDIKRNAVLVLGGEL